MGVETELFGLKNRWDGKEFRVIERADGSIAVLAGEKVLVDSGVTPVTAVPSGMGLQPRGIAPSGSVAADGSITLGTALNAAYNGLYLYFPAGLVSGAPAGFYWVVMSSTTAGVVYSAPGGAPIVGTGAYTGVTSEVTLWVDTIPRESIKGGRRVSKSVRMFVTNGVGTKTVRARVGGSTMVSFGGASGPAVAGNFDVFEAAGVVHFIDPAASGGTAAAGVAAVADGDPVACSITLQLPAATDWGIVVSSFDLGF